MIAYLSHYAGKIVRYNNFPDNPVGNDNKPFQTRVQYSWGSSDHTVRQYPMKYSDTNPFRCDYQVYGLDCSGFVVDVFNSAGIPLPRKASYKYTASDFQNAINSVPGLSKVRVVKDAQFKTIQSGDILLFSREGEGVSHMGIALDDSVSPLASVFMSFGNPFKCDVNMETTRGPVILTFPNIYKNAEIAHNYYFGPKTKYSFEILRMTPIISGNWNVQLRCADELNAVTDFNIPFPNNFDAFTVDRNFTDYDGSSNTVSFAFTYDVHTNMLSCVFRTTDSNLIGTREDYFEVPLENDIIDNIPTTKTLPPTWTTGCDAIVRLQYLQ